MENNYITALGDEADQKDMELLQKVDELERENEQNKHCIKELKKEILEQKHAIQDFEIERDHNLETIKNQNSLIEFYKKYKNEQNNNNEKKNF